VTALGELLVLIGAVFVLLAGIGVLRFDDVYARMHPGSKAPTLGLLLAASGAALVIRSAAAVAALVLVVVLQFLTGPVGAHLVGRSAHRQRGIAMHLDAEDELARDEDASPDGNW
jgi:multicomponent Na+:H+ antiporter subunit G